MTRAKLIIGGLSLVTAYAFGYYEAPYKIKTETQTVEVDKSKQVDKTDTDKSTHQETTVHTIVKPDGTRDVTVTTVKDHNTDTKVTDITSKETDHATDTLKEVTKSGRHTVISGLVGADVTGRTPLLYGVSATTTLIGPIQGGVFGLSSGVIGASLGLEF